MRMAFFAGAQHVFDGIMTACEPGDEPADKDLPRLDLIMTYLSGCLTQTLRPTRC